MIPESPFAPAKRRKEVRRMAEMRPVPSAAEEYAYNLDQFRKQNEQVYTLLQMAMYVASGRGRIVGESNEPIEDGNRRVISIEVDK